MKTPEEQYLHELIESYVTPLRNEIEELRKELAEQRMNKEFILSAAIWVNDNQKHKQQPKNIEIGFVVCGRRHSNCYQTIEDLKGDVGIYFKSIGISKCNYRENQGFITSLDRFVTRTEGWIIAKANNQIQFGLAASENGDPILISENLY